MNKEILEKWGFKASKLGNFYFYCRGNPLEILFPAIFDLKEEYFVTMHSFEKFNKDYLRLRKEDSFKKEIKEESLDLMFNDFRRSLLTKRKNAVTQIIDHGFVPTDYFLSEKSMLYPVEERKLNNKTSKIIKTCYYVDKKKERRDYIRFKRETHP